MTDDVHPADDAMSPEDYEAYRQAIKARYRRRVGHLPRCVWCWLHSYLEPGRPNTLGRELEPRYQVVAEHAEKGPAHEDIQWKCPTCGAHLNTGKYISDDEIARCRELLPDERERIKWNAARDCADADALTERLQHLGYLD